MTVREGAVRLGVSPSLVYALCKAGLIAHRRHGRPGRRGRVVIDAEALERYRASCEAKPPTPAAPVVLRHIVLK